MSEPFTLYKLIVLYMLEKLDFPLTNGQISEFILDKGYTTYFTLQQALSEMVESNLIREEFVHNRTLYHLTEEGLETIQYFKDKHLFRQSVKMSMPLSKKNDMNSKMKYLSKQTIIKI